MFSNDGVYIIYLTTFVSGICFNYNLFNCVTMKKHLLFLGILCLSTNVFSQYCAASGPDCARATNSWITEVEVDASANASACTAGYEDFTNITFDVDIYNAPLISISYGGFIGETVACNVFVDFNQNENFDEPGEIFALDPSGGLTGVFLGVLSPSADVVEGLTRMRVRLYDPVFGPPTDGLSCGGNPLGYGQVEDYTVNIIGSIISLSPPCATTPFPSDTLNDVCNQGTTLSFKAPAPAATPAQDPAGYNLSLWTSNGAIAYLHQDTNLLTATSFDIPDVLTPGETYYWQVKPYNDLGTNEGCAVWSFITAAEPNPVPVIDVDGNNARLVDVCSNFDVAFNVTDLNGTPYAGATIDWDGTDNTSYPLSDTTIINPIFNSTNFGTTYQLALMIVDEFGCVGVDSVDVTVNETATTGSISSIEGTKICDGEFANLSLTGYSPAGTIEWKKSIVSPTGSLATTDDFDDNHMAGPITQDIYYVAIVDLNGCPDSTNVFIEKEELPFKPAISSESTIFCEGDSVQLTVVWPDAGDFEWNDADMSTTSAIWVKDAASYHVTGTASSNGCSNTSTDIVITEGVKPNNPAIVVNSGTPCIGEALNITAEISEAASMERFVDYAFSETYDADQDFEISDDVIYQFVNKSVDDCPSDTIDYIIVFNETPERPAVSVLNKNLHVNAIATSYDWYLEDGTLMGTTTDTVFDPSVDGVYYVVAKNDPCISLPSETAVVDWVIGINEYGTPGFNVTIYPNPANNLVNVIVENNSSTLILTDVSGKVIVTKALTQGANTLELFVEKGIYLITVSNGNSSVVEKLIVE
jgi:hypothetical protein